MPRVFLDSFGRPLLVLHALAAFALLGACTHQAWVAIGLLRGQRNRGRLFRIYARIVGILYCVSFAFGLLMYPNYRYRVRGLYLDRHEPWASNLFDMKENLLALGLPLAIALFAFSFRFEPERDGAAVPFVGASAIAVWALVAFGSISGLIVTSVRGM